MRPDYKTLAGVFFLILIFSAGNYYIFSRLNLWLSLGLNWRFCVAGAFLGGFAFIVIIWHPFSVKSLYHIAAYWFGFILITFIVFIAGDIIAIMLPVQQGYLGMAALFISLCITVYSVSNNLSGRRVENIKLASPKITNPIRIVLIADTHISRFHSAEYLAGIAVEINRQEPDIVCISGDFADGETDFSAIEPLNEIRAPVYLVMGNHEVWHNHNGEIEKLLSRTGVTILKNEKTRGIRLIGVHFKNGRHVLKDAFETIKLDTSEYNILLYHEPAEVEVAREAGIDLMLSGHTHGGQIFPWNYFTKLVYNYFKGLYTFKGMSIYVSQGTGVWGPPMRLGSHNEITVIDVEPGTIH